MADDEWISCEAARTRMADYDYKRPQFGLARLRSALENGRIRRRGQRAEDPNGEPVEIADEDLAGLIFEPPDRLVRPGSANTPATVAYINIRFLGCDADSFLEEVRARQERSSLQVAESRFDEPRWPLEHALGWIAYRRKEALLLSYDQLDNQRAAASRDSGFADGLVCRNPTDELLKALKAGHLEAIDANHNKLPAEFWDERSSNPRTWPEVRFRAQDILRLWPSWPNLRAVLEKGIKDKGAMLTQIAGRLRKCDERCSYQYAQIAWRLRQTGTERTEKKTRRALRVIWRNCTFGQARSCAFNKESSCTRMASVDVLQANVTGRKAPGTRARRVPLTLADRLAFGNLTINEVCALRNRSRSGFYEDVKKGLVSIEKVGERKSVVRGPVARCYIEGRPIAEVAMDVTRAEEGHAPAGAGGLSNPSPALEGHASSVPKGGLARRSRP